jgi:transposase-like protein
MNLCPYCTADDVTVLGANSEGWVFACDNCDRQWVETDRTIELGG